MQLSSWRLKHDRKNNFSLRQQITMIGSLASGLGPSIARRSSGRRKIIIQMKDHRFPEDDMNRSFRTVDNVRLLSDVEYIHRHCHLDYRINDFIMLSL